MGEKSSEGHVRRRRRRRAAPFLCKLVLFNGERN